MGEHAAVYGRPAVVSAVDLSTEVVASPADGDGVTAELVDLGSRWKWPADFILEQTRVARRAWQAYSDGPTRERLRVLLGEGDAERLAVLAVGEAARSVAIDPDGIYLRVKSELPMGAGLGSSASVASAIIGALLGLWRRSADRELVSSSVFEVERRQHGFPSGVDHQTVIQGGINWASRDSSGGDLKLVPIACPGFTQPLVIDTGAPTQATGEVVEAVRMRTAGKGWSGWDPMEAATRDFREALEIGHDPRPSVRRYHRWLTELGVVPSPVADWIGAWQDAGGAAKVSGAGATAGAAAGCVVAFPPPASEVSLEPRLPEGWSRLPLTIGGPGLTVTAE